MGSAEWEEENIAIRYVSFRYIENTLYLRSHFVEKNSKFSEGFGETEFWTWKLDDVVEITGGPW